MALKYTKEHLLLFLIIIFALALRIIFFVGINWSDEPIWVSIAKSIYEGNYEPNWHGNLRSMMSLPLVLLWKIFGVNEFSATLYPMLSSIGMIILVYLFGEMFYNKNVGLLGAFLLSFFPLDLHYSVRIMPDVPIAFFIALSIFIFLKAERSIKNTSNPKISAISNFLYFLAGFFIGIAYLVKETGVIVFIFLLAYVMLKRKIRTAYLFVIIGFLLVFVTETLVFYSMTKDVLLRYHSVMDHYNKAGDPRFSNPDLMHYPKTMFNLDNNLNFSKDKYHMYFGFFYYFILASIICLLIKKDKKSFIPFIWFFSLFLYLQFGTMDFREFRLMHREWRFLTIITLPGILILARMLTLNLHLKSKKIILCSSMIFLLISSIYANYNLSYFANGETKDLKLMYKFLNELPVKPIYSSGGAINKLDLYFGFQRELIQIEWGFDCNKIKDGYVILNATSRWINEPLLINRLPWCAKNPPKEWKKLAVIESDFKLYPYSIFDPVIYYAP